MRFTAACDSDNRLPSAFNQTQHTSRTSGRCSQALRTNARAPPAALQNVPVTDRNTSLALRHCFALATAATPHSAGLPAAIHNTVRPRRRRK